jgi:2-polyprenyl-6-methoxyphenol hydroxylase-like FAD-dependent oxidoreductase
MTGFLLARAGVRTIVLERHRDFFRDFRGDTVHPSTLQLMHELGLLDAFLKLPHEKIRSLRVLVGDTEIQVADFSHLPTACKYIALMPQWDFLNFLAEQGRRYPGFELHMETEATDLIVEGDRVVGLRGQTPDGPIEIRADLVIGADGRHSTVRERAGFAVTNLGAPMDVLWMRLSRHPNDPEQTGGFVNYGHLFVTLNRGDYWQCAFVIRKGGYDAVRGHGLDAFRAQIVKLAPYLAERVHELKDWDDIRLLTVAVDRLTQWWRPGLLCIGDACDVADRRGRGQSGGAGRGRHRQYSRGAVARGKADDRRPRRGTAPPHLSDESSPRHANRGAEPDRRPATRFRQADHRALARAAVQSLSGSAAHPGQDRRHRRPPGACAQPSDAAGAIVMERVSGGDRITGGAVSSRST